MANTDFDPRAFGAVPVETDENGTPFDPTEFGAIEIDESGVPIQREVATEDAATVPATVADDPGFFTRVGEQLARRGEQFGEIGGRFETQTLPETALQGVGTTLGAAFDIAGEAAASAADSRY